jgi:YD repeat-containing protein
MQIRDKNWRSCVLRRILLVCALPVLLLIMGQSEMVLAETYQYNPQGRLTKVTYNDGSSISYSYDNNGNILSIVRAGPDPGPNQPPNGVIDTPNDDQTITAGDTVNITGTGSDPDGDIPLGYVWDFGGGALASVNEDPGAVVFNSPGIYSVKLRVTDSKGKTDPTPDIRTIIVTSPDGSGDPVDSDGDGVADSHDVFPDNRNESADNDGDGIGDNADTDDDNDGFTDETETAINSDPEDPNDVPDDHRPVKPTIHSIAADAQKPLTTFAVGLSAYSDPDENSTPSGTGWRITDPGLEISKQVVFDGTVGAGQQSGLLLPPGTIVIANTYRLEVRYKDLTDQWSEWSDPRQFNTVNENPEDTNGNGIIDHAEVSGFTDVDQNGVDDKSEGILVVMDAETGQTAGIKPESGNITYISTMSKSELPPVHQTSEHFPFGLFSFRVEDLTPGQTIQAKIHLPNELGPNTKWFSYHPVKGLSDVTHLATFAGRVVTLSLTDGGEKDYDGVANGTIVDPSGPATSPPTVVSGGGGGSCFISTLIYENHNTKEVGIYSFFHDMFFRVKKDKGAL